ncbi:biopolymer transporter ExbD [Odoribacter sp. OttesenSCG-928-A06]|nr:biopolymer transporter ExbD [Odoribacter sp. OttesenSCG-928-A06]
MAIRRKNKLNPNFNMSSMTDIVFLLLIFFLVTSTLVNPNALKLLLPKSTNQIAGNNQTVTVSIDRNLIYYFNTEVTPFSVLESKIVGELKNSDDPTVNIQAEKSVPIEHVVKVMNIAKAYGYKAILSTDPE